jgi:predicted amidophosphoribosyltransferase
MSNAAHVTDGLIPLYRRVPPAGPCVCTVCHSGPNDGFAVCHSCDLTMSQVRNPTNKVVPITFYETGKQVWHLLRYYKDGHGQAARHLSIRVAATLAEFTRHHWQCLLGLGGGDFTLITSVPSTRMRVPVEDQPLTKVIKMVSRLRRLHAPVLMRGDAIVAHRQANDAAFTVTRDLAGHRILLVDDTFTSGARIQSAASALRNANATDVTALVVGRVLDPTHNANCQRIWEHSKAREFSFLRCCLCAADQPELADSPT